MTNRDLMSWLHPSNPRLPYVYENFATWGTANDWDFCPECTGAPSAAGGNKSFSDGWFPQRTALRGLG